MKFIIPLCPVTKKNSQRIFLNRKTNRPFISPSEKFREYEKAASRYLTGYKVDEFPVNVKLLFYMPNKRKCDLTNLIEAIDDVLVKTGVLPDDNYNIIAAHDGSRVYVDKDSPRTEIYIEKIQEQEGRKMSEPSREVYKQWATLAFQQYGLYGEPDDPKPDGYESETIFMNLRSVAIVLSILRDEGKTIVADALRDIYIQPFPENGRMRRVIDSRVIKFSETHFVSTSSVYRYLRDARRLFVSVRLLAKESQN